MYVLYLVVQYGAQACYEERKNVCVFAKLEVSGFCLFAETAQKGLHTLYCKHGTCFLILIFSFCFGF